MDYDIIAAFGVGLFSGVTIVRYGINYGVKMVYKIKDDIPVFEDSEPTEQEVTGE